MNTLINMNPWSFLEDVLNANSNAFRTIRARAAGRFPPVNVLMDDNAVIVDVELPGKTAADVEITLEQQAVIVADKVAEPKTECAWRRRLELPFRANAEKANAKFTDGILRIELPKAESAGLRRIAISE